MCNEVKLHFKEGNMNQVTWSETFQDVFKLCYPIGSYSHDDVIEWKHFSCYWPFVQGIYQSPDSK